MRIREVLRNTWRTVWGDHQWAVVALLWLTAYCLGVIGVSKQPPVFGDRDILDLLYRPTQLFVLDDGMAVGEGRIIVSWQLQVARFLSPAVAGYTAFAALAAFFQEQSGLLKLFFFKEHVVICGLGRKGDQLAKDFLSSGHRVVVIELDDGNDEIRGRRADGAVVIVGNATDRTVLHKARIDRAKCLITMCGDDGTNVEVAVHANNIVRASPSACSRSAAAQAKTETSEPDRLGAEVDYSTVQCFVHIVDLDLRSLLGTRFAGKPGDPIELRFFNIFESGGRALLETFPPDVYGGQTPDRQLHVLVIGFGQFGESVVTSAAHVGHYVGDQHLRIAVIDRDAEKKERAFRARYPHIDEACDLKFVEMDYEGSGYFEGRLLWGADEDHDFTIVYVCLDEDSRALACALDILPRLSPTGTPIIVRMSDNAGLATLLQSGNGSARTANQLQAFLMINDTCHRRAILNDEQDLLAKVIHRNYARRQLLSDTATTGTPYAVPWHALPEEIKTSNRLQADHIPLKLRAIGCTIRPAEHGSEPRLFAFSAAEVELMSRMEHQRWKAERFLGRWSYAPGPRNTVTRTHPDLVPYDDLTEDIKEWDRHAVRDIPGLLAQIDQEVVRG